MKRIPRGLAYDMLFGSNKIDGHKALDLIYDGFEARYDHYESFEEGYSQAKRDFESRTCESCKHFVVYDNDKVSGHCINDESIAFGYDQSLYGDDGCNKWEAKDE